MVIFENTQKISVFKNSTQLSGLKQHSKVNFAQRSSIRAEVSEVGKLKADPVPLGRFTRSLLSLTHQLVAGAASQRGDWAPRAKWPEREREPGWSHPPVRCHQGKAQRPSVPSIWAVPTRTPSFKGSGNGFHPWMLVAGSRRACGDRTVAVANFWMIQSITFCPLASTIHNVLPTSKIHSPLPQTLQSFIPLLPQVKI